VVFDRRGLRVDKTAALDRAAVVRDPGLVAAGTQRAGQSHHDAGLEGAAHRLANRAAAEVSAYDSFTVNELIETFYKIGLPEAALGVFHKWVRAIR